MAEAHPIPSNRRFINLTGQKFDRLTAISYAGRHNRDSYWNCLCSCGKESVVTTSHLRKRTIKSCGCLRRDILTTHGHSKSTPEYRIWSAMKTRCTNPRQEGFPNYGGRGIKVCERWLSFENFLADMGHRPSPTHEIDRIDNNGNYEPDNCHWATKRQNRNNRRDSRLLTHEGKTQSIAQWAEELGFNYSTLYQRLKLGWTTSSALNTPNTRSVMASRRVNQ